MTLIKHLIQILAVSCLALLAACSQDSSPGWQGYAEGDYVYVAAPRGGRLMELMVHKGDQVTAGKQLYGLDPEPEASAVSEARKRLEQTGFRRDDLATGERPSELDALKARREQARVARDLAKIELDRYTKLLDSETIPRERYDRARADFEQKAAALDELEARLVTAKLGGRDNQRKALNAEMEAAAETLRQAEWALSQKNPIAVADALVFDTLYEPGELVPVNAPVVVLLPPGGRKARFYVPEADLSRVHLGDRVRLSFDGGTLAAVISYIAPRAEYTPPVIYSRETRTKLVYLLEAHPKASDAALLTPGQPLEVTLE